MTAAGDPRALVASAGSRDARSTESARRSPVAFVAVLAAGLCVVLLLAGLGGWQLQRRAWKLDRIERVDARLKAAPVAAPGPEAWSAITQQDDEYRRVTLSGTFLNDRETLVQAVTGLGAGLWVLTPFQTDAGFTVLVNRGFVPGERRDPASRSEGQIDGATEIAGLLRLTEPGGAFLRANDPAAGRWYSRDVAAIAAAKHLGTVAPYFVDADGRRNPGGLPVGGLTVVAFANNHLVYALTWFAMAVLLAAALLRLVRERRRPV